MEVSGVDRCSLAGDNGFQETGHELFAAEARSTQRATASTDKRNHDKVEIFLERKEVAGQWKDILVVKREEEKKTRALDRIVARLRIKVIVS